MISPFDDPPPYDDPSNEEAPHDEWQKVVDAARCDVCGSDEHVIHDWPEDDDPVHLAPDE